MSGPAPARQWWLGLAACGFIVAVSAAFAVVMPLLAGRPAEVHVLSAIGKGLLMALPAVVVTAVYGYRHRQGSRR